MFKTAKQFEESLLFVLTGILNHPENENEWRKDLDDLDFKDILAYAKENVFIFGIAYGFDSYEKFVVDKNNPRLSYEGLKFIESLMG